MRKTASRYLFRVLTICLPVLISGCFFSKRQPDEPQVSTAKVDPASSGNGTGFGGGDGAGYSGSLIKNLLPKARPSTNPTEIVRAKENAFKYVEAAIGKDIFEEKTLSKLKWVTSDEEKNEDKILLDITEEPIAALNEDISPEVKTASNDETPIDEITPEVQVADFAPIPTARSFVALEPQVPVEKKPSGWMTMNSYGAPSARHSMASVWTGNKMIVWGSAYDSSGGIFDPVTNSWSATSKLNAPTWTYNSASAWTGSKMIVWGGIQYWGGGVLNTGGMYDPTSNSWSNISTLNAPSPRFTKSFVWTGNHFLVWGGMTFINDQYVFYNDGASFNPENNTWSTLPLAGAPSPRQGNAVWTGTKMLVWGGNGPTDLLGTGTMYDMSTNTWSEMSQTNAPEKRAGFAFVWTGSKAIVWGGTNTYQSGYTSSGKSFDPIRNEWNSISDTGAPSMRSEMSYVWSGKEMIIFGGYTGNVFHNTGGKYNLESNSWTPTTLENAPRSVSNSASIWAGDRMIIWGGVQYDHYTDEGAVYFP